MRDDHTEPRRPCIALMGEFSAGKSTLANLLIGEDPLPVQVVATQLCPVRISFGDEPAFAVLLDGETRALDLNELATTSLEDVAYIQIFCAEDILKQCDLLDMPGISDPNMAADVWERMIGQADGVLWCSHATQAWRQSEAAVWAEMHEALYDRSLLLLTRSDKLQTQRDRDRVVARVRRETEGLFRDVLPISLLLATQEQDDYDAWVESGAAQFAEKLIELLKILNADMQGQLSEMPAEDAAAELRLPGLEGPETKASDPAPARETGPRVMPRRVRQTGPGTARPPA